MISPGAQSVRSFVLGYGAGVLIHALLVFVGNLVLRDPCAGRTAYSLLAPLLLGPGGLGLAAYFYTRGRTDHAMFALGLVMASLFPALFVAARGLEYLKSIGCAPLPPTGTTP